MFASVLVANRGEIAVRVIRTLQAPGHPLDRRLLRGRRRGAARARRRPRGAARPGARRGVLPLGRARARRRGADRARRRSTPATGSSPRTPTFAAACEEAGLVFIGPPPAATRLLGDKVAAKTLAERLGVPVLPGPAEAGARPTRRSSPSSRRDPARLPLMIKAAAGGGGRGMRIVRDAAALADGLAAARREALAGFGDDSLLVERYVERARHVEVQILADSHGDVVHLGERECSLQRRHQKVVEETPVPGRSRRRSASRSAPPPSRSPARPATSAPARSSSSSPPTTRASGSSSRSTPGCRSSIR